MYTTHVFIHLTDKIRNEIDKSNYARGTFVNFKKEFDIVDHHVLLKKKKEYYDARGIPDKWLVSYLSNIKHYFLK